MDFQSVLVESENDINGSLIYGTSGIMINNKYILTTSNIIYPFIDRSNISYSGVSSNLILKKDIKPENISFNILSKGEKVPFRSQRAMFLSYFLSKNISHSTKTIFRYWTIDSPIENFHERLSIFIILRLDENTNTLTVDLNHWFKNVPKTNLTKGQNLRCISTAFGNRKFMNQYGKGIVSNVLGDNNCLVFSDLALAPGSEGSPIFCDDFCQEPIGIVISTINWWKNEWLNFTVIADMRPLLVEILQSKMPENYATSMKTIITELKLLSTTESCLFQIYNGSVWGTAILIDKEKGILITNAHVIEPIQNSLVLHRSRSSIPCDVIYSNVSETSLDIAVVKAKTSLGDSCQSITLSRRKVNCGDVVFAAGFPIFTKETNTGATLTKGYISQVHPQMIKTTCSVYPGASGGAILDEEGCLLAVIVCNAKIYDPVNMMFPKINMNIPISLLEPILKEYIETEDSTVLTKLSLVDARVWNFGNKL